MWATCEQCGRETRVPNSRGSRLADRSCPSCGGRLRGSGTGRPSKLRGAVLRPCVSCGVRTRFETTVRGNARWTIRAEGQLPSRPDVIEPGSPLCGRCTVFYEPVERKEIVRGVAREVSDAE